MRARWTLVLSASVALWPLASAAQVAPLRNDPLAARPSVPGDIRPVTNPATAPANTPAIKAMTEPTAKAPLANPDGTAPTAVPPATPVFVLPPPPPPMWLASDAQALLGAVQAVGGDGLDSGDYDPAKLDAAIRGGDPAVLAQVATDTFNRLSWDLAMGHVARSARQQWFVVDKDLNAESQRALLVSALARHDVPGALASLLPTHPQYGSLKSALAVTASTDIATVNRIRLNMERWRWLPRDLGQKYIIVNVPSQFATLVENSQTRWKHRAIAGAIKTQTPQLSVLATGVILNPWWEVPASLTKDVAGKAAYVPVKGPDGKIQRWRQPPGPGNALGKIKFVMQNPHAIYLHDTNNRGLFDSHARFLSHGCIRTEKVLDLAAELLGDDNGEWTQDKIDAALASGKSVQANFVKPVPVYIVYFSAAALVSGKILPYDDLYQRDAPMLAALDARDGKGPFVAKPKVQDAANTPVKKPVAKKKAA